MRSISAAAAFVAATTVALASAPAAVRADALVYEQGGQGIWMASPDGARKHQVTADTGFTSPSAADDGTLMLVSPFQGKLHRVDRYGRALNAPVPAAPTTAAGNIT